jgi:uncharacterized protein YxeA
MIPQARFYRQENAMKKLIFVVVVLVAVLAIWRGYVQFTNTGDRDKPSVTVTVDPGKVAADKEKAKDLMEKQHAPANP